MKSNEKMKDIFFFSPWFAELQICIANWRHPLRKRLITARLERKEPPKKLMQSQPLPFLPCVPEWCLCLDLCHHSQSWWPELPKRATADLVAPQNWNTWTNPTSIEFNWVPSSLEVRVISLPEMLHGVTRVSWLSSPSHITAEGLAPVPSAAPSKHRKHLGLAVLLDVGCDASKAKCPHRSLQESPRLLPPWSAHQSKTSYHHGIVHIDYHWKNTLGHSPCKGYQCNLLCRHQGWNHCAWPHPGWCGIGSMQHPGWTGAHGKP